MCASWIPLFIPKPPIGGNLVGRIPGDEDRPWANVSATAMSMFHSSIERMSGCRSGTPTASRTSSIARSSSRRGTLREALRLLARDGWVVVLPRKGYLIRPLALEDVREIFGIRAVLEPEIAKAAATSAGPGDIARLQTFVDLQAAGVDDLGGALMAARHFHEAVIAITDNARMSRILGDLLDEVRRLHFLLPNVESHITSQEELRAHRELVQAIADRDGAAAGEIMRTHINEVARTIVRGFSGL